MIISVRIWIYLADNRMGKKSDLHKADEVGNLGGSHQRLWRETDTATK